MGMHEDDIGRCDAMITQQLLTRGIKDARALQAMRQVPRHRFVPERYRAMAYDDMPLPIGQEQTISQPLMVALMTEALQLSGSERVLEIGTGSGYQAAILGRLASVIFSLERLAALAVQARATLAALGIKNVHVLEGDGSLGLPEHAPYDAILVTAGAPKVPQPLIDQLNVGGRLVIPVGDRLEQTLMRVRKTDQGLRTEHLGGCRFVPLIGLLGWHGAESPAAPERDDDDQGLDITP
jgi:protein-L-isoaspartate(D-aspartate) O-methyltransferase